MHSRDLTIVIVLLWFNSIVHYSRLSFLSIYYRPYSSKIFNILYNKIEGCPSCVEICALINYTRQPVEITPSGQERKFACNTKMSAITKIVQFKELNMTQTYHVTVLNHAYLWNYRTHNKARLPCHMPAPFTFPVTTVLLRKMYFSFYYIVIFLTQLVCILAIISKYSTRRFEVLILHTKTTSVHT